MGLGDVFIEKGSHLLCGSQAGLELVEILNARITGVSRHTQLTCLLFLFGFLWRGNICKRHMK